jgi:hypothetical protein
MKAKRYFLYFIAIMLLAISNGNLGYATETTDTQLRLKATIREGQQAFLSNRYAEAEKYFKMAAEQAFALHHKGLYAYCIAYEGYAQVHLNKLQEAEANLSQAEKDAVASKTPIARTLTYQAFIAYHDKLGNLAGEQKYTKAILRESPNSFQALKDDTR